MAQTSPIKNAHEIKACSRWLEKNADPIYALLFKLDVTSGIRIEDLTNLRWDMVDWNSRTITFAESKGTKSRITNAKNGVLKQWYNNILKADQTLREALLFIDYRDLLTVVPDHHKVMIELSIEQAVRNAKPKTRVVDLSPKLVSELRLRKAQFDGVDSGYIFSSKTMLSNRARGSIGTISRQSCTRMFKRMGEAVSIILSSKVVGSSHGLRRTYARLLYSQTNDMNIVLHVMGWSSIILAKRYLGLLEDERIEANNKVFAALDLS